MPFARVGAMPQPTSNKQRNGNRKNGSNPLSRQKGITMEDLKKQTALRLAQEQQQKQIGYYADPERERPLQNHSQQQLTGYGQQPPLQSNVFQTGINGFQIHPGVIPTPQIGHPAQSYHTENSQFNPVCGSDTRSFSSQRVSPFDPLDTRQLGPRDMQLVPGHRDEIDHLSNSQCNLSELTPAIVQWSQLDMKSAFQHEQGVRKQKQKLPHGLTVSELKEMTKARLQAEAAEKPGSERPNDYLVDSRRMSPLDFDSVPETRERAPSRDSGWNDDFLHRGPGSTNSIPSLVQVSQQPRDSFGRQPQVSPLPVGFHNSGSTSTFPQQKSDAWESVSVASHNSTALSENYGSESVISSGIGSGYAQPPESDARYDQTNPFTGLEEVSFVSSVHTSPSTGNMLFDATIGGNRRRAMTSSPRTMSIHEDRPILHSDELRMPSFSSSSRGTLHSRPSGNYSPVLGFGLDDQYLSQHPGLAPLGGTDLNRPRTFSGTSAPSRSHVTFEFNRDRANTFNGFSTARAQGDGLTDCESTVLTESFLRVSRSELEGRGNAIHSDSLSGALSSPPGFFSGSVLPNASCNVAPLTTARSSDLSSTWAGGISSSFFESDLGDLADTMGSILKLSGVGSERPDRERSNTYPNSNFR